MLLAPAIVLKTFAFGVTTFGLLEFFFRHWYRRNYGKDFVAPVKYAWGDQYICSHPNFSLSHVPAKVLKHSQMELRAILLSIAAIATKPWGKCRDT